MIRELVTDEATLSTPCTPATVEDAELAADLIETLRATEDGCCLAANQVGVTKSVVVFLDDDGEAHVLYNPKLLFGVSASQTVEGCLTREEPSRVRRFQKVRVTYDEIVDGALKQRRREFTGWEAQMVQHMIDHCRGRYV
jgi:peptide deformylase